MSGAGSRKADATGRSSTTMKSHARREIDGPYIIHTREMRNSIAWQMLKFADRRVLDRIEEEHMANGGYENGNLVVTYHDFEKAGVRSASISTAVARVEALGFIECVSRGRPARMEFRVPSTYRLTYALGNLEQTNEWRKIDSRQKAEARINAALDELHKRSVEQSRRAKEAAEKRRAENAVTPVRKERAA